MRFKLAILLLLPLLLVTQLTLAKTERDSSLIASIAVDSSFTIQPSMDYMFEKSDVLHEGMIISAGMDSVQFMIDKARAVFQKIRNTGNFIKNIDEHTKFELPVGLPKMVDGIDYELAIDAIRLKPSHAELDVFLMFTVPSNGQELYFMGRGIKYTRKGGIVGDATLVLLGDYGINMNGNKAQILLKANETYATIDCDGFKELGVGADVKFSRDLIVPENPDGTINANANVLGSFKTILTGWNDLIVQLSLPAFQMKGLPGVSFNVLDAVFDFSDLRNAPNVRFPDGYQSNQMLPDNQNLWRGFYLRDLTIKLPKEFKQRGSSERIAFNASNVIIDNMGLTGKFSATSLMTLEQGDMNGWAFSVSDLNMEIATNSLVEAGFNGAIVIPVAKAETPFEYSAIINTGGNYLFHVSPATDLEFEVFKAAKVEIYEASYLDIKVEDGKFLPKANLHGSMDINASLSEGGQGVTFASINFENLEIQSVKPYLKIGSVGFGSEGMQQMMAGFPISIQDLSAKTTTDNKVSLDFKLKLNLVKEESGAFAADAGLSIIGEMDNSKGWQSWKYKDIQVHEIGVDIDGGAYKIQGNLVFYKNDPTYGDGFNGTVNAEFKPGIKVRATAIFGNVRKERYWYADALMTMPQGVPIFTGVAVYGFGGGIFYGMKIDKNGDGSALGRTASGVTYIPDGRSGIGLKAMITLASSPKPQAFNAEVFFEIAFFKAGGVRYIGFGGNGTLITPGLDDKIAKMAKNTEKMVSVVSSGDPAEGSMSKENTHSLDAIFGPASEIDAALAARVYIEYDFENTTLHGNFEVFIDVAGGVIRGVGDNNRAGWAVLHFAPKEWYIYVGTPEDRVGISVGIGPIRASATSYFMVGTKILGSPPPPARVSKILGGVDLDYMKDLNAIGEGGGFAFGAAFEVSTGDLNFLMFYARLDAGAGFDIMLKDYGNRRCEGSNDRIGINGWYANGQAYAYFEGAIGIRIKVFGIKKRVKILELGAAAVLQAKLPNPFWMRGTVGGYFSVLGGAVRGNCKFQVTIGNECKIISDPNAILDDIKVISEMTPGNGETEVNVFTAPQSLFNLPIEKEFELVDDNKKKRLFKIKLDHFTTTSDGKKLVGDLKWNDDKSVVVFNPYEILPPKKEVRASVQISFQELINGAWTTVVTDGKKVTELEEVVFRTGEAPDYIPHQNVAYSYPTIGQVNYLKDETDLGYIKLKQAQPYLFSPGPEWVQKGRFSNEQGSVAEFDFKYTYSSNMIEFKLPGTLKNDQVYVFELVNVPAVKNQRIDRNVSRVTNKVAPEGTEIEMEIDTKKADGSVTELEEKPIYTSLLRTSHYSTFNQKMDSYTDLDGWAYQTQYMVFQVGRNMRGGVELFDKFEVGAANESGQNLIRFEAELSGNAYYKNLVYPILYRDYPINDYLTLDRTANALGVPPVRAIYMRQNTAPIELTDDNSMNVKLFMPAAAQLIYDLPTVMYWDFQEIQTKCAYYSLYDSDYRIEKVLQSTFPAVREGIYEINIGYYLPGINKATTVRRDNINFTRE